MNLIFRDAFAPPKATAAAPARWRRLRPRSPWLLALRLITRARPRWVDIGMAMVLLVLGIALGGTKMRQDMLAVAAHKAVGCPDCGPFFKSLGAVEIYPRLTTCYCLDAACQTGRCTPAASLP